MFSRSCRTVFFVQPAPVINCGDPFTQWVLSLPKSAAAGDGGVLRRRRSVHLADRRSDARPFEAGGIKTVYKTMYPAGDDRLHADRREGRFQQTRHGRRSAPSPRTPTRRSRRSCSAVQPEGPLLVERRQIADRLLQEGRACRTRTACSAAAAWFSSAKTPGNTTFVSDYVEKYGGNASGIDRSSAEAYARRPGRRRLRRRRARSPTRRSSTTLHSGTWPTVEGNLSWDSYGSAERARTSSCEWIRAAQLCPSTRRPPRSHKPEYRSRLPG